MISFFTPASPQERLLLLISERLCVLYPDRSLAALAEAQNRLQYILCLLLLATLQYRKQAVSHLGGALSVIHTFLSPHWWKNMYLRALFYANLSYEDLHCFLLNLGWVKRKREYFSRRKCDLSPVKVHFMTPSGLSLLNFWSWVKLRSWLFSRKH